MSKIAEIVKRQVQVKNLVYLGRPSWPAADSGLELFRFRSLMFVDIEG